MKNIRDKIEDIFRNYPDVGVNRNKFLIDELEQLFFQEKQEIVEKIDKDFNEWLLKDDRDVPPIEEWWKWEKQKLTK